MEIHQVKLDEQQRADYDVLFQSLKLTVDSVGFDETQGGAALLSNYTTVLEGLLRLRQVRAEREPPREGDPPRERRVCCPAQVCCCPSMIKPERIAAAKRMLEVLGRHSKATAGAEKITLEQAKKLFEKLKQVRLTRAAGFVVVELECIPLAWDVAMGHISRCQYADGSPCVLSSRRRCRAKRRTRRRTTSAPCAWTRSPTRYLFRCRV